MHFFTIKTSILQKKNFFDFLFVTTFAKVIIIWIPPLRIFLNDWTIWLSLVATYFYQACVLLPFWRNLELLPWDWIVKRFWVVVDRVSVWQIKGRSRILWHIGVDQEVYLEVRWFSIILWKPKLRWLDILLHILITVCGWEVSCLASEISIVEC